MLDWSVHLLFWEETFRQRPSANAVSSCTVMKVFGCAARLSDLFIFF